MPSFLVPITDRPERRNGPVAFYLFRRTVEAVEYQPGIQRRLIGGV